MTNFLSSLYILEISHLFDVGLVKFFSHSVGCRFVLLTMSFALQSLLSFRRSHLLIVSLSVCAAEVLFRKWSPVPIRFSVLPTFSSKRFSVAGFMLRSLIHLDLSIVHGDRYGVYFQFSSCWYPVMPAPFVKYAFFFPFDFFASLSKIRCLKMCRLISGSSIQFHWSSCLFLCQYQDVFSTVAL